jgi:hypothetical protein
MWVLVYVILRFCNYRFNIDYIHVWHYNIFNVMASTSLMLGQQA